MFRLTRLRPDPILEPIATHPWEAAAVFNCGVTVHNGLFHMFYRAADRDFQVLKSAQPDPAQKFTSAIGYAVSIDGIHFKRLDQPIFTGDDIQETWGVEDPRICRLHDVFYMLYTGFGGRSWDDHRICLATSTNLIQWDRQGVVLDEPNKDAAFLEATVGGRYMLFHRREPHIWAAFSADLLRWTDHQIVLKTRPGTWESKKIGLAGPPIAMDCGWLLLYHAVDDDHVYRLGAALLDSADPTKVLARLSEPILEPALQWEREGLVPNVVFSNGHALKDGDLFVYYGGADTVIGVASIRMDEIRF